MAGHKSVTFVLAGISIVCYWAIVDASRCLSHEFNNGSRCCRKCPPGAGVLKSCNTINDTTCTPCRHSQTFSNKHSHTQKCLSCSKCDINSSIKYRCNVTHDTKCECNRGYFERNSRCVECTKCQPGWGATRQCSPIHNTVCRKCPNGTHSSHLSSTDGCVVCTKCGRRQGMLQACSPTQDTICIDLKFKWKKKKTTQRPIPKKHSDSSPQDDIIPVYCAIMGVVIVGLIAYVIYKQYVITMEKKAQNKDNLKYSAGLIPAAAPPGVYSAVPSSNASECQKTYPYGADSGVFLDQDGRTVSVVTLTSSSRIRSLPNQQRTEIEQRLLPKHSGGNNDWAMLARELGYSQSKIFSIEAKANYDAKRSVSSLLLQEWSKSDNATLGVLIRALRKIGRTDCVKILKGQHYGVGVNSQSVGGTPREVV